MRTRCFVENIIEILMERMIRFRTIPHYNLRDNKMVGHLILYVSTGGHWIEMG